MNPHCLKAGLDVDGLKNGINSTHAQIPAYLLTNGAIFEIKKMQHPWPKVTDWLKIWMGPRFPASTPPSRVSYFINKLFNQRVKLLRSKTSKNITALQKLEEEPFVLQPVQSRSTCPKTTQSTISPPPQPVPPFTPTSATTVLPLPSSSSVFLPIVVRPVLPASSTGFLPPSTVTRPVLPASSTGFLPPSTVTRPVLPASSTGFLPPSTVTRPVLPPSSTGFLQPSTVTRPVLPPSSTGFLPPSTVTRPVLPPSSTGFLQPSTVTRPVLPPSSTGFLPPSAVTRPVLPPSSTGFLQPSTVTRPVLPLPSEPHMKHKYKLTRARELRKDRRIVELKSKLKSQKKEVNKLQKRLKENQLRSMLRLKRLKKLKIPVVNVTQQTDKLVCDQCLKYEEELTEVKQMYEDCKMDKEVNFKQGGQYSPDFKMCVLNLLNLNVANHNVSNVISSVLKLLGISASDLPCATTVENIAKLRKPLVNLNLVDTLEAEESTTLYSDGTTKYGRQYETFAVSTSTKDVKVLGLREMADKTSETILRTLQSIVTDLNVASPESAAGKQIFANIRNTMSDRAASEKCFEEMMASYRQSILPEVTSNWATLTEETREKLGTVHNFHCGLHLLVNCAEKVAHSLAIFQSKQYPDKQTQENKVVEFIRTSCKTFAHGGDEKSGCQDKIAVFLAARGVRDRLSRFRGTRFNILFHNAAVLYHLHPHLTDFIQLYWGTPNRLMSAVQDGLTDEFCIAGCRALGLLNKFLTKPLWQKVEDSSNILTMNDFYRVLINVLNTVDAHSLLDGTAVLIPGYKANDGSDVFKSLTKTCDNDVTTETILQVLLKDIATLLQRLVQDQLPGGTHDTKTAESNPECESVIKHNKVPETVFARLDFNQHRKPSASDFTHESAILFHFNKVGNWLERMTEEERNCFLNKASVLRNQTYNDFKRRQETLQTEKQNAMERKRRELQQRTQRYLKRKTVQTNDIVFHGLWQSKKQVMEKLTSYSSDREKVEAIKVQLRFRRNVLLQCPSDKKLFLFSEKRKQHSLQTLISNLVQVVEEASSGDTTEESSMAASFLTGQMVRHAFMENGSVRNYRGKVISQVPGFPTWFNIVYDSEPATVYTYQLEDDWKQGDLTIISDWGVEEDEAGD